MASERTIRLEASYDTQDVCGIDVKEEVGAQPPIELQLQFQDHCSSYDRKKWCSKEVSDSTICCSAVPPGGSHSELTERSMRHFNGLSVPKPHI